MKHPYSNQYQITKVFESLLRRVKEWERKVEMCRGAGILKSSPGKYPLPNTFSMQV
jgi:hypothetical protein